MPLRRATQPVIRSRASRALRLVVAVVSILIILEVLLNILSWAFRGYGARTCPAYLGRCYTLADLRGAYGIQPLLDRGIDGRGRTVMVTVSVGPQQEPRTGAITDIRSDLRAFDAFHGLPPTSISVVAPPEVSGVARFLADSEEVQDVEMAHAIAPGAAIRVLEVPWTADELWPRWNGSYLLSMLDAILVDPDQPDVVSVSFDLSERCLTARERGEVHVLLGEIAARGITVVAGSGDWGVSQFACGARSDGRYVFNRSVAMPAADPLVTGVGGTTLDLAQSAGRYVDEVAWNQPPSPTADPNGFWAASTATGGGFGSAPTPAYQLGLTGGHRGRGVPDVAADADWRTGITITSVIKGRNWYRASAGTSASTPLWAAIVALADQYAHRRLGSINPALYRIATNPQDRGAFHPVTSGDNSELFLSGPPMVGYLARAPWSPVTGLGSPIASRLVPLLAASTAGR